MKGTIRLYESGGTRELILQDDVRSLTAQVVQQR